MVNILHASGSGYGDDKKRKTRGKPPVPAGNRNTIPRSSSSLSNAYTDKFTSLMKKLFAENYNNLFCVFFQEEVNNNNDNSA